MEEVNRTAKRGLRGIRNALSIKIEYTVNHVDEMRKLVGWFGREEFECNLVIRMPDGLLVVMVCRNYPFALSHHDHMINRFYLF